MPNYCIYLRKSRADREAELHGEGETLARHERTLIDLAHRKKLNITAIYKEIVSGETIASRPEMQKLLSEVEQGIWDGVLVMEVERLARGDTKDQGTVAEAFKYSNTKIITPNKVYDPNNEFDEEYFEFGLFMSRREYKTINRRLQRGRIASAKEGKYVGNIPPYGYERTRIQSDKGWTLAILEEQADVVRLIFEWYTVGEQQANGSYKRLGTGMIARRLIEMNIPTQKGYEWLPATIRNILVNPVYAGFIRWNAHSSSKKVVNGQIIVSRTKSKTEDCICVKGIHPPIISEETFQLAQEFLNRNPPSPVKENGIIKNPLCGLIICGKCGKNMIRRKSKNDKYAALKCEAISCDNVSSYLHIVEERVLQALDEWLENYKIQWDITHNMNTDTSQIDIKRKALKKQQNDLNILYQQVNNIHDFLEQGIYSTDTFLERSRALTDKINKTKKSISMIDDELETELKRETNVSNIIPKVEKLLEIYHELPSQSAKNQMLKEVLEKVVYIKKDRARRNQPLDNFEIIIYPKLPASKNI